MKSWGQDREVGGRLRGVQIVVVFHHVVLVVLCGRCVIPSTWLSCNDFLVKLLVSSGGTVGVTVPQTPKSVHCLPPRLCFPYLTMSPTAYPCCAFHARDTKALSHQSPSRRQSLLVKTNWWLVRAMNDAPLYSTTSSFVLQVGRRIPSAQLNLRIFLSQCHNISYGLTSSSTTLIVPPVPDI